MVYAPRAPSPNTSRSVSRLVRAVGACCCCPHFAEKRASPEKEGRMSVGLFWKEKRDLSSSPSMVSLWLCWSLPTGLE